MRSREDILRDRDVIVTPITSVKTGEKLVLEVLLDIRELLQNPPMEISGVPTPTSKE